MKNATPNEFESRAKSHVQFTSSTKRSSGQVSRPGSAWPTPWRGSARRPDYITATQHEDSARGGAAYVNLKKLKGENILLQAAVHNLRAWPDRQCPEDHIDIRRSAANTILAGPRSPQALVAMVDQLLLEAGVGRKRAIRKDAVRALEIVVTWPCFTRAEPAAFFPDVLQWLREFYGCPVLSAVVHRDESVPHIQVLLLPLIEGRLIGSDLAGKGGRLSLLQAGLYEDVLSKYGLKRPRPKRRMTSQQRKQAADRIEQHLLRYPALIQEPAVRLALRRCYQSNPVLLMEALALSLPKHTKRPKGFVAIMTSPCKAKSRH